MPVPRQWNPIALQHSPPSRVDGTSIDQSQSPGKRLQRWELTLSWLGRPWVLRGSHRRRSTPADRCGTRDFFFAIIPRCVLGSRLAKLAEKMRKGGY